MIPNTLDRRGFCTQLTAAAWMLSTTSFARAATAHTSKPNIVYILADDLGWGDMGVYNAHSAVPMPHCNNFATQGMRFTDMHASSAVCSPSRYSILTGRYPWRSRLKKGVLEGDSPNLIEPGRTTVPSMLKEEGYYTAGAKRIRMDRRILYTAPRALTTRGSNRVRIRRRSHDLHDRHA